jgi:hypothetical protein
MIRVHGIGRRVRIPRHPWYKVDKQRRARERALRGEVGSSCRHREIRRAPVDVEGLLVIGTLRNRVRGLLRIRKQRAVPRRSAKPAIGAYIVREDVRMTIQAGMSDHLWHWLLEQGWREATFQPDRRRYRDIPSAWVTRLIDATPEVCARVLDAAVDKAVFRPSLRAAGTARPAAPRRREAKRARRRQAPARGASAPP